MMEQALQARFKLMHPGFTLDVDLQLPGRGITGLFGPSGSGKTSCLRCIAGLERPAIGRLLVNGAIWQDSDRGIWRAPHQRPIGYVFQDANLFPHLSVQRNLEYGLQRIAKAQRRIPLQQAVDLLGIGHLLQRLPDRLSGGERQRVGVARALLTSPQLLLMDEPLAALDLKRKQEVLPYLERLQHELDIPMLYVSHALDEVARLANHLVVLEQGKSKACGPLQETLMRSDLPFIFEEDAEAVIEGQVAQHDASYDLLDIRLDGTSAMLRLPHAVLPNGRKVRIKVKARDVSLSLQQAQASSLLNLLPAQVVRCFDLDNPAHRLVELQLGEQRLLARITRYSFDQLRISAGLSLWAQIKSVSLLSS